MPKIGVFDSGIGGESVALALRKTLPNVDVITKSDQEHVPYGDKTPEQVYGFVVPLIQQLVDDGCDVIVIACNTVTTWHIARLREHCNVPIVGIEPMVKPASEQTKTHTIAVCATPATLASPRYAQLKQLYAKNLTVLEPDCSAWAYMIEHNKINLTRIAEQIDALCNAGADAIVLGCTHYHWIYEQIVALTQGRAVVLQPEEAVVRQVRQTLRAIDFEY